MINSYTILVQYIVQLNAILIKYILFYVLKIYNIFIIIKYIKRILFMNEL